MTGFPEFHHTIEEVRQAGKTLKSDVLWNDAAAPEIERTFKIANDWRDSHAYPMQRVRAQVIGQLNRLRLRGPLTAARLKRMPSIRKKLQKLHLDKIQDLAGVRVILPTMQDVATIIAACRDGKTYKPYGEDDYIARPKASGYRSHHLKLTFVPLSEEERQFAERRIELQIRTQFQHSWATAVETVGLFQGEDLKGGGGHPDWLRLFALMASEIAYCEGQPELPGAPARADRIRELRDLNKRLRAAALLDGINQAVDFTGRYYSPHRSEFYLIRYDLEKRSVQVNGFDASHGTQSYHATERQGDRFDSVLVAADKVDQLKQAFPNYFGDVQHFARSLRRIVKGKDAIEYILPPQARIAPKPRDLVDPRWLRRSARQRG